MLIRPIGDRERWCLLCSKAYQASSYTTPTGFCFACRTPERRRELKRVATEVSRAKAANLLATLTISEWLTILDHFQWKCAYCGGPFDVLEHIDSITQGGGTTKENAVPSCIACNSCKDRTNLYLRTAISPERIDWVKSELARIQHRPPVEPMIKGNSIFVELSTLGLIFQPGETINLRVRAIALQQGISKGYLQRKCGVPMLTLDHYWFRELRIESIHLPTLKRIAESLHVPIASLFCEQSQQRRKKEKGANQIVSIRNQIPKWQAQVQDLGKPNPESKDHQLLRTGIYAINSMYSGEVLLVPAKGLLEIAAYVDANRAKLEQEAATPEALELAADAARRHERVTLSLEERNV